MTKLPLQSGIESYIDNVIFRFHSIIDPLWAWSQLNYWVAGIGALVYAGVFNAVIDADNDGKGNWLSSAFIVGHLLAFLAAIGWVLWPAPGSKLAEAAEIIVVIAVALVILGGMIALGEKILGWFERRKVQGLTST